MQFLHPAYRHHFIFVHHTTPPSDTWLNIVLGAAAIATVLGFAGGLYLAVRYGRKLSVAISGETHPTPTGVVIAARPSVRAVGVFRVHFNEERGAVIRATEVYINDDGDLTDGRYWERDDVFGASFVEGGEELTTTTLFQLPEPVSRLVGWRLSIEIRIRNRFIPGSSWSWADQVFVPKP
jgi:hypothetical protein